MNVRYDPDFLKHLKKLNVRVHNHFKDRVILFSKDPNNAELNNHELKREWVGYRSIDITADWRAIYKEIQLGNEVVAYFVAIGIHKQLYK